MRKGEIKIPSLDAVEFRKADQINMVENSKLPKYFHLGVQWIQAVHFVEAHFDLKTFAVISRCASTRQVVLLQNEDSVACFSQTCTGGQATQTAADNDGIIGIRGSLMLH